MSNVYLTPFVFDDALVRIYMDASGNPWFVAKDVCAVLEIGNSRQALSYLEEDEKGVITSDTLGGRQEMSTVSESGLYSLIFRSRKPEAKRFRTWVTGEVLPTIRKTGGYAVPGGEVPPLPELPELPETAKRLKPLLRERVLASAIQAARLVGATTQAEIDALFIRYCQLVSDRPPGTGVRLPGMSLAPDTEEANVQRFIEQHLEPAPRAKLWASDLYACFARWWRGQFDARVPSPRLLGRIMQECYVRRKAGNIFYEGVTIRNQ